MQTAIIAVFFVFVGFMLFRLFGRGRAIGFMIMILFFAYFAGAAATISMIWFPPGWTNTGTGAVGTVREYIRESSGGSILEKVQRDSAAPKNRKSMTDRIFDWAERQNEKLLESADVLVSPGRIAREVTKDRAVFTRYFILLLFFLFGGYFCIVSKWRDTRLHRLFRIEKPLRRSKHDAHGSSRWATDQEVIEVLKPGGDGIIMAARKQGRKLQPLTLPLDDRKRQGLNSHSIIFGPPGSRKSRGFVIPNILQANCSYVITDPSGEIYAATSEYLRDQGYVVQVLNLDEPARSDQWNFKIETYNDAMDIASNVIKNTTPPKAIGGDPFWEKAEQSLLQAILLYMWKQLPEEQINFYNLLRLATMKPEELDSIIESLPEEHEARIAFATFLSAPEKTRGSIVLGFSVRLAIFRAPDIARLTARAAINLHNLCRQKTAIFVVIPEVKSTYEVLSALFFTSAFQSLLSVAKREGLKYPVHLILDEFANIGSIPDFQRMLATVRKYGISVSIILQSINQLKAKYPEFGEWESIVGNCDNRIILGVNDVSSAEYFVKLLGKQTIETRYESRRDDVLFDAGTIGWREFGREIQMVDELGRLDMDNLILLQRGRFPALLAKYDYSHHPAAKWIRPASVFEYRPEQQELVKLALPDIQQQEEEHPERPAIEIIYEQEQEIETQDSQEPELPEWDRE